MDYLSLAPEDRPRINLPAVMSIACTLSAMGLMFSVFAGAWKQFFPPLHQGAGWIVLGLSICAVIWGAIGALRAPRESGWYSASLLGYAGGMFVGTLSPILFMI